MVTGNPPKLRALVFVADVQIEIINLANELLIAAAIAIVPVLGALTNVINGAIVTKLRVNSVIGKLRKGDGRTRGLANLRNGIRLLERPSVGRFHKRDVSRRDNELSLLIRPGAVRRSQRAGRHRIHAGRSQIPLLAKVRHPDLDIASENVAPTGSNDRRGLLDRRRAAT
jgi:hypothetical protein